MDYNIDQLCAVNRKLEKKMDNIITQLQYCRMVNFTCKQDIRQLLNDNYTLNVSRDELGNSYLIKYINNIIKLNHISQLEKILQNTFLISKCDWKGDPLDPLIIAFQTQETPIILLLCNNDHFMSSRKDDLTLLNILKKITNNPIILKKVQNLIISTNNQRNRI